MKTCSSHHEFVQLFHPFAECVPLVTRTHSCLPLRWQRFSHWKDKNSLKRQNLTKETKIYSLRDWKIESESKFEQTHAVEKKSKLKYDMRYHFYEIVTHWSRLKFLHSLPRIPSFFSSRSCVCCCSSNVRGGGKNVHCNDLVWDIDKKSIVWIDEIWIKETWTRTTIV